MVADATPAVVGALLGLDGLDVLAAADAGDGLKFQLKLLIQTRIGD